jgi:protoheme IX farnesyltransferase
LERTPAGEIGRVALPFAPVMQSTQRVLAFVELSKPRITLLLLLVSMAAFWLASGGQPDVRRLSALSVGITLLAAGMFALNQYLERDIDGLMRRTESRPLPAGRIRPVEALIFGCILIAIALGFLFLLVNALTGVLGAATVASYLGVYTPLKKTTPHCTLLGAFPGAMPPLLGWAAVRGHLDAGAWALFAILFLWQFPHFHSIACLYKEDYSRASVRLWAVVEPSGRVTVWQILGSAAILIPVSVLPSLIGLSGQFYFWGAMMLGSGFLWLSFRWTFARTSKRAQQLLVASVVYLPVLLALMILDPARMR